MARITLPCQVWTDFISNRNPQQADNPARVVLVELCAHKIKLCCQTRRPFFQSAAKPGLFSFAFF